ncbi:MAG: hypothetical protein GY827_04275 [Cytophagales bacterium]|nr:hypothetical protein [Cytophagales bacterium]
MEYFFEHKRGYIAIDEENLYLTKDKDWEETHYLTEKKTKTHNPKTWKSILKDIIIESIVVFVIIFVVKQQFSSVEVSEYIYLLVLGVIVHLIMGIIEMLFKFPTFKIPLHKTQKIQNQNEVDIEIHFENKNGKIEFILIQKMEMRDIKMIKSLVEK